MTGSLRWPKLFTLVPAALAIAACGDRGQQGTDKAAGAQPAKPVVSTSSEVPRYAGKPGADTAPEPGALARFKQLPLPGPNAVVPNVRGSDVPLEQFLDTVGNDAATYWQQVFNNSGYKLDRNRQLVVVQSGETACGSITADQPAGYCTKDGTVYLPVGFFRAKIVPIGDAAAVTVVGVMYGYRALDLLGAFEAAQAGRIKPTQVNLGAVCMAGAWEATVAKRNLFEEGDVEETIAVLRTAADTPGTAADDPNATGTEKQLLDAFTVGFKGGPSACQDLTKE